MGTSATVSIVDERSITVPIPANAKDTAIFVDFLVCAHEEGYDIKAAQTLEHGQRDPIVHALRVTMAR